MQSSFLTGEFRHTLDDRSRVAVPVRFRQRLSQGATLARWLDNCLGLFPQDAWDELAGKLSALPLTNTSARQFARFMSSGAVEVELDKQGRILVPGYLREYAGLSYIKDRSGPFLIRAVYQGTDGQKRYIVLKAEET